MSGAGSGQAERAAEEFAREMEIVAGKDAFPVSRKAYIELLSAIIAKHSSSDRAAWERGRADALQCAIDEREIPHNEDLSFPSLVT